MFLEVFVVIVCRNYVHVSQQKVRSRSETNLKSAISAKSAFLGCGFKTENLVWDEYGLPIPYQDIPVYFTNNGRKVCKTNSRLTLPGSGRNSRNK